MTVCDARRAEVWMRDDAPHVASLVRRASRRLLARRIVEYAAWGLAVGILLAASLIIYHRLVSPAWDLLLVSFVAVLASPIAVVLSALMVLRRDPLGGALALDHSARLDERFSSLLLTPPAAAAAATTPPDAPVLPTSYDAARAALARDAERHADGVDLARAIPLRAPRALTFAGGALAFALLVALLLPTYDLLGAGEERTRAAVEKERVAKRNEALKKRMEEIQKVAEEKKLSTDVQKVLKMLAERAELDERLKKEGAPPRREAQVELDKMRKEIAALRERPEMQGLAEFLKKIEAQASPPAENPKMRELAKALESGDLERASKMMEKLGADLKALSENAAGKGGKPGEMDSMTKEQLAQLSRDMAKLAPLLAGIPELSKKFGDKFGEQDGKDGKIPALTPEDLAKLASMSAEELERLARMLEESQLLDTAMEEIELTADELASLPEELGGELAELCDECKKGVP